MGVSICVAHGGVPVSRSMEKLWRHAREGQRVVINGNGRRTEPSLPEEIGMMAVLHWHWLSSKPEGSERSPLLIDGPDDFRPVPTAQHNSGFPANL